MKMKIVVYDPAARKGGGGETILRQYFDIAAGQTEHEWWFFVSIDGYQERNGSNIHVCYVAENSGSKLIRYGKRKCFELFDLKKMIREIQPDELISLQNMVVPGVKCKQIVYLHQSLQFSPVTYRFWKRDERNFAFRQRVICKIIRSKLPKADQVIVQTEWMKQAVAEWAGIPTQRIVVERPIVSLPTFSGKEANEAKRDNVFFYPANAYLNKNHRVIIDACKILKEKGYHNYRILFTLSPNGGRLAEELYSEVKSADLPIEFIGHLEKKELFEKYRTLIMLFPSYIETFGLPLLEAKSVGGRVIASNSPFAHEILDRYEFAEFVDWDRASDWALAIQNHIAG